MQVQESWVSVAWGVGPLKSLKRWCSLWYWTGCQPGAEEEEEEEVSWEEEAGRAKVCLWPAGDWMTGWRAVFFFLATRLFLDEGKVVTIRGCWSQTRRL